MSVTRIFPFRSNHAGESEHHKQAINIESYFRTASRLAGTDQCEMPTDAGKNSLVMGPLHKCVVAYTSLRNNVTVRI